jgi:putative chitinase
MRPIDAALLTKIAEPPAPLASSLAPILATALPKTSINTLNRVACFLGQGIYETLRLQRLEEDLSYSAPRIAAVWPRLAVRAGELAGNPEALANAAYGAINGNGGPSSGDGWLFHGRGFLMLTGRANYRLAGFDKTPDDVATPEGAIGSAIAFWLARNCNAAADAMNVANVTRLVNGGLNGFQQRLDLTNLAKELLT